MTWYYALGNERQGPVDDAVLDGLIASGVVTADTLVWKAGMPDWQPLAQARPRVVPASAPVVPPPPAAVTPTPAVTPAPGATDPSTQPRLGSPVSSTPAVTPTGGWSGAAGASGASGASGAGWSEAGAPGWAQASGQEDPDEIYARVTSSRPTLDIGACVARGWQSVSSNPGLAIGGPFLIVVATTLVGMIPCVGVLTGIFLNPALLAGIYKVFIKLDRGEQAEFGDLFAGFEGVYLNLILQNIVLSILVLLACIPGGAVLFVGGVLSERAEALGTLVMLVGGLLCAAPIIYLALAWMFSVMLIVDRQIDFWPAMELSRKVVQQIFGSVFLLALTCMLIVFAGLLALCVGIFVAIPIAAGTLAAAYHAIFGVSHRRLA